MKKEFSTEFKLGICELVKKDRIKASSIAEQLGIDRTTVYRWVNKYDADVGKKLRYEKTELNRLKEDNEQLKRENKALKELVECYVK